jgi:hypothetical protein
MQSEGHVSHGKSFGLPLGCIIFLKGSLSGSSMNFYLLPREPTP